ncbi:alkaline phosphatase family protein [Candidatus Uabimicrobium amorphum]|uniref:Nucleotide pyrophosphatase n=1 Tax=Uabimicrobium amorphum TaxID=2596890 RepID=A0A5S9ITL1_UABAM|nr:alkaline phosphatase family protein [Candidatus Uabimicrobium amorphum]BBM86910.1 nucleotide pyrophosphatase [Candidatus Uabimicrobium amorphum]
MSKTLNLFVFIDAFGWELLQKNSFLDDILHTKTKLDTVLGYSCTCDPTILTGKMPHQHGHFSFFYYNPQKSPFRICRLLDVFPKFFTKRGRVRRLLSKLLVRYYKFTGYFQIYNMPFRHLHLFDYSEKRDIYQQNGINSGASNIFDHLREKNIAFYLSDWRRGENENIQKLHTAICEQQVPFAYLYLAAMDATLHQYGTDHELVTQKIAWYSEQLQGILNLAKEHYRDVKLHIFSDHGMTNVCDTFDLMSVVNNLSYKFGKDFVAVYDSTMARFWFLNENARHDIEKTLKNVSCGRILSQEELSDYGCYFSDHRYGELFFLMNPGVLICPSFMGDKPLKGMHGYCPHDKDSTAMFCCNYTLENPPKRLDDLYSLMKSTASENE